MAIKRLNPRRCIGCHLQSNTGPLRALQRDTPKTDSTEQTAQVVNALFLDLQCIFPAWKQSFPTDQLLQRAKTQWIKGFIENQITTERQVQRGLHKARQSVSPYFPSLGQFIGWCEGEFEWVYT